MPKKKGSVPVPVKAMPSKPPEALSKKKKAQTAQKKPQLQKKPESPPEPAVLPEPTFPPNPPMRPSGPLLGGFQSAFTQALRDLGLTPDEDRVEYAIQQLSHAVWETLQPRIDEEIWHAQVYHSRQGRELHAWNPNPVPREHEEVPLEVIQDEEEADEEAEQDDQHDAWQDASWDDYDNYDDNDEEGQEVVIANDAVMLPASIQIHHSSNIQR